MSCLQTMQYHGIIVSVANSLHNLRKKNPRAAANSRRHELLLDRSKQHMNYSSLFSSTSQQEYPAALKSFRAAFSFSASYSKGLHS